MGKKEKEAEEAKKAEIEKAKKDDSKNNKNDDKDIESNIPKEKVYYPNSWRCDGKSDFIDDIRYHQVVINSEFTKSVTTYENAILECKQICVERNNRGVKCTGFFYQQHQ